MKMKIFSVRDKVADMYFQPFIANNDEVAKRDFINSGRSSDIPNFSDYELHCIGVFDSHSGELSDVKDILIMSGNSIGDDVNV